MPSFVEIGPPVPEKIFEEYFIIHGHGGHRGHVTWIIYIHVGFPFPIDTLYSGFREEDL